jgi:hypothetical protein
VEAWPAPRSPFESPAAPVAVAAVTDNGDGTATVTFDAPVTWNGEEDDEDPNVVFTDNGGISYPTGGITSQPSPTQVVFFAYTTWPPLQAWSINGAPLDLDPGPGGWSAWPQSGAIPYP